MLFLYLQNILVIHTGSLISGLHDEYEVYFFNIYTFSNFILLEEKRTLFLITYCNEMKTVPSVPSNAIITFYEFQCTSYTLV
jgi:hypothetical protein